MENLVPIKFQTLFDRRLVRRPASGAVFFSRCRGVSRLVNAATDDDDVAAVFNDDVVRGVVLLAHGIATDLELYARGHVNQTLTPLRLPRLGVGGNETHDKVWVLRRHANRGVGVFTLGHRALGAHFSEQEQTAALGEADRFQTIDDATPRDDVRVSDVTPVCNLVHAASVLTDDGVANVCKLAIFENQKVVLLRNSHELFTKSIGEIRVEIAMRLEHANLRSKNFSHL
mmetsp:Transcript_1821/g.4122  ORF Transcript_1821/g.4122 Transcript_1821/m.4122 type:complete len:229 (-) Transcript_1821:853-1539(-)